MYNKNLFKNKGIEHPTSYLQNCLVPQSATLADNLMQCVNAIEVRWGGWFMDSLLDYWLYFSSKKVHSYSIKSPVKEYTFGSSELLYVASGIWDQSQLDKLV